MEEKKLSKEELQIEQEKINKAIKEQLGEGTVINKTIPRKTLVWSSRFRGTYRKDKHEPLKTWKNK